MKGKCVIVGAGEWRGEKFPEDECGLLIAVDGGYAYCKRMGVQPELLVGDFDSVSKQDRSEIDAIEETAPERVVRLQAEKDDTDTLAAVRIGLDRGFKDFWLCGGMGGRLEHTVANIQTLLYLKGRGASGCLADGECALFVIQDEEVSFPEGTKGYLSLFCLGERAEGVTLTGMKYPLTEAVLTNDFPVGISNEFTGKTGMVKVRKGSLLAVARWENV